MLRSSISILIEQSHQNFSQAPRVGDENNGELTRHAEKLESYEVEIEDVFEKEDQNVSDVVIMPKELGNFLEFGEQGTDIRSGIDDRVERLFQCASPLKEELDRTPYQS